MKRKYEIYVLLVLDLLISGYYHPPGDWKIPDSLSLLKRHQHFGVAVSAFFPKLFFAGHNVIEILGINHNVEAFTLKLMIGIIVLLHVFFHNLVTGHFGHPLSHYALILFQELCLGFSKVGMTAVHLAPFFIILTSFTAAALTAVKLRSHHFFDGSFSGL